MTERCRKNTSKKKKQTNKHIEPVGGELPDKMKIPVIKGFEQNGEETTTNIAVGLIKYTVKSHQAKSKMLSTLLKKSVLVTSLSFDEFVPSWQ